jgi:hypothetical protein
MDFQEAKRKSLEEKWKPIQRDTQMLVFRVQQTCGFCAMLTEHAALPKCKVECAAYSICKGGTGLADLEDKLQEASDMALAIIKQIEKLEVPCQSQ